MTSERRPDDRAWASAASVGSGLRSALQHDLLAVYLHGSAALGGFHWDRSDLDLLVLTGRPLTDVQTRALPVTLGSLAYPAKGLELSVMTAAEAARPTYPAPRFQLHVATDGTGRMKAVDGRGRRGDRDLVLHLAVCRGAGLAVVGPAPAKTLAVVPADEIRTAVIDEIRWAVEHDAAPEYVVLTAARAWRYVETGQIVSKTEAGRWAEPRTSDAHVIAGALRRQGGGVADVSREEVRSFAERVLRLLDPSE
jgi:Aminoglycoside adenylyltransferase, C-terminal domain